MKLISSIQKGLLPLLVLKINKTNETCLTVLFHPEVDSFLPHWFDGEYEESAVNIFQMFNGYIISVEQRRIELHEVTPGQWWYYFGDSPIANNIPQYGVFINTGQLTGWHTLQSDLIGTTIQGEIYINEHECSSDIDICDFGRHDDTYLLEELFFWDIILDPIEMNYYYASKTQMLTRFTNTQYTGNQEDDLGYFVLPFFRDETTGTSTHNCPFTTQLISTTNYDYESFIKNPTLTMKAGYSHVIQVHPNDLILNTKYTFYIFLSTNLGFKTYSSQMTLFYGCPSDITFNEHPANKFYFEYPILNFINSNWFKILYYYPEEAVKYCSDYPPGASVLWIHSTWKDDNSLVQTINNDQISLHAGSEYVTIKVRAYNQPSSILIDELESNYYVDFQIEIQYTNNLNDIITQQPAQIRLSMQTNDNCNNAHINTIKFNGYSVTLYTTRTFYIFPLILDYSQDVIIPLTGIEIIKKQCWMSDVTTSLAGLYAPEKQFDLQFDTIIISNENIIWNPQLKVTKEKILEMYNIGDGYYYAFRLYVEVNQLTDPGNTYVKSFRTITNDCCLDNNCQCDGDIIEFAVRAFCSTLSDINLGYQSTTYQDPQEIDPTNAIYNHIQYKNLVTTDVNSPEAFQFIPFTVFPENTPCNPLTEDTTKFYASSSPDQFIQHTDFSDAGVQYSSSPQYVVSQNDHRLYPTINLSDVKYEFYLAIETAQNPLQIITQMKTLFIGCSDYVKERIGLDETDFIENEEPVQMKYQHPVDVGSYSIFQPNFPSGDLDCSFTKFEVDNLVIDGNICDDVNCFNEYDFIFYPSLSNIQRIGIDDDYIHIKFEFDLITQFNEDTCFCSITQHVTFLPAQCPDCLYATYTLTNNPFDELLSRVYIFNNGLEEFVTFTDGILTADGATGQIGVDYKGTIQFTDAKYGLTLNQECDFEIDLNYPNFSLFIIYISGCGNDNLGTCPSLESPPDTYAIKYGRYQTYLIDGELPTFYMPLFYSSWQGAACCQDLTYDIISNPNSNELQYEFTQNILTDTIHVTLNEANLCTPGTFTFYLKYCVNQGKCNNWSDNLYSLEVKYDPNDNRMIQLETGYATNEEIEAASNLGIYKSEYDYPVLNIIKNFIDFFGASINVTQRFRNSYDGCNFVDFRIDKVVQKQSQLSVNYNQYSQLFKIYSDGTLEFKKPSFTIQEQEIYVAAYNGLKWSSSNHVATVTYYGNEVFLGYVPPIFTDNLATQQIEIFGSENCQEYIMPQIFDFNNNNITVKFYDLPDFITYEYDWQENQIKINYDYSKLSCQNIQETQVNIELSTVIGSAENYTLDINVTDPASECVWEENLINQANTSDNKTDSSSNLGLFQDAGDLQEQIESLMNINSQNFTAYIKEISSIGLLTIEFNSTVNIPLDEYMHNSSFLDIYIIPSITSQNEKEEDERDQQQNRRMLNNIILNQNLSWNLVSFENQKTLEIQLEFEDPFSISQGSDQDRLYVNIPDEFVHLYNSSELQKSIHESSRTMSKKIKRQMENTQFVQSIMGSAEGQVGSLKLLLIIGFLLNYLPGKGLKYYVMLVRSLQMFIHLMMMRILVPSNVSMLFSIMFPIVNYDLLDSDIGQEFFALITYDQETQNQLSEEQYSQIVDLGYETHNMILNLGTMTFFFTIFFIRLCIFLIILILTKQLKEGKQKQKLQKQKTKLNESLFFDEILILIIEGYFELCISSYLAITDSSQIEIFSIFLGYVGLMFIIIVPLFMICIFCQSKATLQSPKFKKRWGVVYQDVRMNNKWQILYHFMFVMRRFLFVAICFGTNRDELGILQLISILYLNIFIQIYQGHFRPLDESFDNNLELVNEVIIYICTLHFIFFTDWVGDIETQFIYGWSALIFVQVIIAVNFIVILYFIGRKVWLVFIKYKNRYDHKQNIIKEREERRKVIRARARLERQQLINPLREPESPKPKPKKGKKRKKVKKWKKVKKSGKKQNSRSESTELELFSNEDIEFDQQSQQIKLLQKNIASAEQQVQQEQKQQQQQLVEIKKSKRKSKSILQQQPLQQQNQQQLRVEQQQDYLNTFGNYQENYYQQQEPEIIQQQQNQLIDYESIQQLPFMPQLITKEEKLEEDQIEYEKIMKGEIPIKTNNKRGKRSQSKKLQTLVTRKQNKIYVTQEQIEEIQTREYYRQINELAEGSITPKKVNVKAKEITKSKKKMKIKKKKKKNLQIIPEQTENTEEEQFEGEFITNLRKTENYDVTGDIQEDEDISRNTVYENPTSPDIIRMAYTKIYVPR